MHQKMLDLILTDAVAYTEHNAQASIMDKWSKEQLTFALSAMSTRLRILRNALHREDESAPTVECSGAQK